MSHEKEDHLRHLGYFIVALASLITGMILGYLGAQTRAGSRIQWSERSALQINPRSLKP
jgi:hypothetical protein